MYTIVIRRLVALGAVYILTLSPQLWACGDIAVVSRDARFIVLNGDTLTIKDVGNLWWLGFLVIDGATPGSTLDLGLISVERVVLRGSDYERAGGYFILKNLERKYTAPLSVPSILRSGDVFEIKWVTNGNARYLLAASGVGNDRAITIMDTSLTVLGRWKSPEPSVGAFAACIDAKGRIILGGLEHRVVIDQGRLNLQKLDKADRSGGYRLSAATLTGCKATMGRANANNDSLRDVAIIDLAENRVISEYSLPVSYGRHLPFADGSRLLQQEVIATPEPNAPNSFRVEPTTTFKVIDTSDGSVTLRRSVKIVPGFIHEQLLCKGASERVAIQSPSAIHLLDLKTLEIVASKDLPFERYFVLGSSNAP